MREAQLQSFFTSNFFAHFVVITINTNACKIPDLPPLRIMIRLSFHNLFQFKYFILLIPIRMFSLSVYHFFIIPILKKGLSIDFAVDKT